MKSIKSFNKIKNLNISKMSNLVDDYEIINNDNNDNDEFIDYGDVIIKETVERRNLEWLINHYSKLDNDEDRKLYGKLKKLKKDLTFSEDGKYGSHNVNYCKNEYGRLYAKKINLQNSFNKKIRNTLIYNICKDIDLKNACFSILMEEINNNDDNTNNKYHNIIKYYQDRDKYIGNVMNFFDIDRSIAKELFIFCISVPNDKNPYYVWKTAHKIKKDNNELKKFIEDIRKEILDIEKELELPDGVTINKYINEREVSLLLEIKEILKNYKTSFNTLIHDGGLIMINKYTNNKMIDEINEKLQEYYKYIQICYKPFEDYYIIDEKFNLEHQNIINNLDKSIKNVIDGTHKSVAELFVKKYGSFIKSTGSNKERVFFVYQNHSWKLDKGGNIYIYKYLDNIEKELRNLSFELLEQLNNNEDEPTAKFKKELDKTIKNLGSTPFIKNTIEQISNLLYEDDFYDKLDVNPFLIGFDNGIFDLEKNEFRNGKPEDLVSFSVKYDYNEPNEKDYKLLKKLIEQILYIEDERIFYLKMLSTMLMGRNIQGIFINIGSGANGKSLIASILFKALGDYICKVNNTILGDAIKTGANPEIAKINKKRGIIIQEPNKRTKLNIATVKELTGGAGEIKARKLYSNNDNVINLGTYFIESNDYLTFDGEFKNDMYRRVNNIMFRSTYIFDEKEVNEEKHIYLANAEYECSKWIDKMKMPLMKILLEHFQLFKMDDYKIIRPESVKSNNNTYMTKSTDFDKFFNDKIEKSDNPKDYVRLVDFYNTYKNDFVKYCNIKVKSDFIQIVEKHPIYGKHYRERTQITKHILKGYKLIEDDDDIEEDDNE